MKARWLLTSLDMWSPRWLLSSAFQEAGTSSLRWLMLDRKKKLMDKPLLVNERGHEASRVG